MAFPPAVGSKWQTHEGRVFEVVSTTDTGLPHGVFVSTVERDVAEQFVPGEEWEDFEAVAKEIT